MSEAINIIGPLDAIAKPNIVISDKGNLEPGSYRIAIVARAVDSLDFSSQNITSPVSFNDIELTGKKGSSLEISFNQVPGASAYNIYLAKIGEEGYDFTGKTRYAKKSEENTDVTIDKDIVNYTITDLPDKYGVDSFSLFADSFPGKLDKNLGSVFVVITDFCTISDIVAELKFKHNDFFYYDGFNLILKGGIEITGNFKKDIVFNNLSIIAFQGGFRNLNSNMNVIFGSNNNGISKSGCSLYSGRFSPFDVTNTSLLFSLIHSRIIDVNGRIWTGTGLLMSPQSDVYTENLFLDKIELTYTEEKKTPLSNITLNVPVLAAWDGVTTKSSFLSGIIIDDSTFNTHFDNCVINSDSYNIQAITADKGEPTGFYSCKFYTDGILNNPNLPAVSYSGDNRKILFFFSRLTILVSDESSQPVENAAIVLRDKGQTIIAILYTDSSGKISQNVNYAAITNENGKAIITNHYPFNITINRGGYMQYNIVDDLDEDNYWKITLTPNPAPITFSIRRLLSRIFASGKPISSAELITEGTVQHSGNLTEQLEIVNQARATYRPDSEDIVVEQLIEGSWQQAEVISEGTELQRGSQSVVDDPEPIYIDQNIRGEVGTVEIEGKVESLTEIKGEILCK